MKICIYGAGAMAIAETFGVKFRVDVDRRIEGARKVGAHKTSMPQDLERGRPMEIDPLVTVVQEMGRLTKIPTPALDTVLALVAQRARIAGLYDGNVRPAETKSGNYPNAFKGHSKQSWESHLYGLNKLARYSE